MSTDVNNSERDPARLRSDDSPAKADRSNAPKPRLLFIDNLRWTMILLVVSQHAAVTYSGVGSWYYHEKSTLSLPVLFFFLTYQAHLQAFFMGLLFLLAGYFVPGAFDKKGPGRFLHDRATRLGLPTLLYVFAIGPLTLYCAPGLGLPTAPVSFLFSMIHRIANGAFLSGTGPLWFCVALLIFCVFYALARMAFPRSAPSATPSPPPSVPKTIAFVAALALATFLVRTVQPMGTSVLNMQLCFFSQYVLLFGVGIAAYRNDWLMRLPQRDGMRRCAAFLIAGTMLWVALLAFGGAWRGKFDAYGGGWHWQSAGFCVWESLVCVGVCMGLIVGYRERFNRQGALARLLSANAFCIYVWHAPVLVALSRSLIPFRADPSLKFVALTVLSFAVTLALSEWVFRRIPGLRSILA